jgi:hypothetical protein
MLPCGPGQDVYKPFENNKLPWLAGNNETAASALSRQGGQKPSLILFLSSSDSNKCMARNYERVVFRDQSVVDFAKANFVCVRLERLGPQAKPFNVNGPELIVQDSEGTEVARFIECTTPSLVMDLLKECVTRQKEVAEKSKEWAPKLAKADEAFTKGNIRDAASIVAKAHKETKLSRFLRDKAENLEKALEDKALAILADARTKDQAGDTAAAYSLYRTVKNDYAGLPSSTAAKTAMTSMEKDPAKKEKLREARAEDALDAARELAAQGKKPEAMSQLRTITLDFGGTKAAADAKQLLDEMKDPSWKPAKASEPAPEPAAAPAPAAPATPAQAPAKDPIPDIPEGGVEPK